jgi:hypothetical protein
MDDEGDIDGNASSQQLAWTSNYDLAGYYYI